MFIGAIGSTGAAGRGGDAGAGGRAPFGFSERDGIEAAAAIGGMSGLDRAASLAVCCCQSPNDAAALISMIAIKIGQCSCMAAAPSIGLSANPYPRNYTAIPPIVTEILRAARCRKTKKTGSSPVFLLLELC